MATKIRAWLDEDRETIHHANSTQIPGMFAGATEGITDCTREGTLRLVHHENVDMGKLCPDCMAVSGPNPALEGNSYGPV